MPGRAGPVLATHRARITKTIEAPIDFVYRWCTDFRPDDGKLSTTRPKYKVLKLSRNIVVRVRTNTTRSGKRKVAVELVRLQPPNAWHVDQIDETDLEAVDYTLTRLGPRRTRITLDIIERWMVRGFPSRRNWVAGSGEYWDRLVRAIETRYRSGRPALG